MHDERIVGVPHVRGKLGAAVGRVRIAIVHVQRDARVGRERGQLAKAKGERMVICETKKKREKSGH